MNQMIIALHIEKSSTALVAGQWVFEFSTSRKAPKAALRTWPFLTDPAISERPLAQDTGPVGSELDLQKCPRWVRSSTLFNLDPAGQLTAQPRAGLTKEILMRPIPKTGTKMARFRQVKTRPMADLAHKVH